MINDDCTVVIKSVDAVKQEKYKLCGDSAARVIHLNTPQREEEDGVGKKDVKKRKKSQEKDVNNIVKNVLRSSSGSSSAALLENANTLSHENMLGVCGIVVSPPQLHLIFAASQSVIGNLRYVVKHRRNEITIIDKLYWLLDIALVVQYLHSKVALVMFQYRHWFILLFFFLFFWGGFFFPVNCQLFVIF